MTYTSNNSFIFFWKPHEINGFLGQWYNSPFEVDGVYYTNAEQFMMAEKAKLMGDEHVRLWRGIEALDPDVITLKRVLFWNRLPAVVKKTLALQNFTNMYDLADAADRVMNMFNA